MTTSTEAGATEGEVPSPSPMAAPGGKLDCWLCRVAWGAGVLLALLIMLAIALRLGAGGLTGRLVRVSLLDVKLPPSPGEASTWPVVLRLRVENHTPMTGKLCAAHYRVEVGTSPLGAWEWHPPSPVTVPPFGAAIVELEMSLDPSALMRAALTLLRTERPAATLRADLEIDTWLGRWNLPVTAKTSLPALPVSLPTAGAP